MRKDIHRFLPACSRCLFNQHIRNWTNFAIQAHLRYYKIIIKLFIIIFSSWNDKLNMLISRNIIPPQGLSFPHSFPHFIQVLTKGIMREWKWGNEVFYTKGWFIANKVSIPSPCTTSCSTVTCIVVCISKQNI